MIQPIDLGAPAHLASWRPIQEREFAALVGSDARFNLAGLPVGTGKSLLAWAYARLLGARAVILTSTKGLMDQYEKDFEQAGLRDVRGMQNYPCRALGNLERCDAGPCLDGQECLWRESGCAYFDKDAAARQAQIALTNYAWWFSHPGGLGQRDLLICDEAHAIPEEVTRAAGTELHASKVALRADMAGWTLSEWRLWALEQKEVAAEVLRSEALTPAQRRDARKLYASFATIVEADEDTWAHEWSRYPTLKVRFEPIEARLHTEAQLFRGIAKVLLLSGTARPVLMEELGIAPGQFAFREAASPFPVARRPIYWLHTGIRVNSKTSQMNLEFLVAQMDKVIAQRLQSKGIIHTVSYARARFIRDHSRYAHLMILHSSEGTRGAVERFKREKAPAILVSPSMHTGWDFPYDTARWQIIAKVPFPDTRFGIAAARAARDPLYSQKQAAQTLQQMAGRVVRAEDDLGETIIIDDAVNWLFSHYRPWFAGWFRDAYQPVSAPPPVIDFPLELAS